MCYYDYDYETEPNFPEAEEIINESIDKFKEFLRGEFVNEYKAIQLAKENNDRTLKNLQEKSNSLTKKENELKQREEELAKSEEVQYQKLKAEWFTELGLAFDIGSTVYYIKDVTKLVTCPTCNGTKKVRATITRGDNTLSELEINCPTCTSYYGRVQGDKEFEVVEATVIQIDAHISKMKSGNIVVEHTNNSFELITRVWVEDKKGHETHYFKGCNLYKTKEECQKAIERKMKPLQEENKQ